MANVQLVKEIRIETENKVGMLAEITSALSNNKINIKAVAAYTRDDKAEFMILVDNNDKAYQSLRGKGYVASEKEVVLLKLEDKVGALKQVSEKIKAAGINLNYLYGTTCSGSCDCHLVLSSNDNKKLTQVLI